MKIAEGSRVESSMIDYFDIMVVVRTGVGKTTTVDKLLIASLPGQQLPHPKARTEPKPNFQHQTMACDEMVMWLISDK